MQTILPADAQAAAVAELLTHIEDAFVTGYLDSNPEPGKAVVVTPTGGVPISPAHISHQLTFTAWGERIDDVDGAFDLAARAYSVIANAEMAGSLGGVPCSAVTFISTPYLDRDPVTGSARFTFTATAILRNSVA